MNIHEPSHNYLLGEYIKQLREQADDLQVEARKGNLDAQEEYCYVQLEIHDMIEQLIPWSTIQ